MVDNVNVCSVTGRKPMHAVIQFAGIFTQNVMEDGKIVLLSLNVM